MENVRRPQSKKTKLNKQPPRPRQPRQDGGPTRRQIVSSCCGAVHDDQKHIWYRILLDILCNLIHLLCILHITLLLMEVLGRIQQLVALYWTLLLKHTSIMLAVVNLKEIPQISSTYLHNLPCHIPIFKNQTLQTRVVACCC